MIDNEEAAGMGKVGSRLSHAERSRIVIDYMNMRANPKQNRKYQGVQAQMKAMEEKLTQVGSRARTNIRRKPRRQISPQDISHLKPSQHPTAVISAQISP